MKHNLTFLALALMAIPAAAHAADEDPNTTITSIRTTEMNEEDLRLVVKNDPNPSAQKDYESAQAVLQSLENASAASSPAGKFGAAEGGRLRAEGGEGASPAEIVEMGKTVWEILKENAPEFKSSLGATASALPAGKNWADFGGWKSATRTWKVELRNAFNITVVEFWFELQYSYGGNYKGKGQYLSYVAVTPAHVNVLPAFEVDADAKVLGVQNMGSPAHPIAGMKLDMSYMLTTKILGLPVRKQSFSRGVTVKGNGDVAWTEVE